MMHKKKVALVFPSFKYPTGDIPWGVTSLRNYLQKNSKNSSISIIDTSFQRSFKEVERQISEIKPDITGVYMDTLMYSDALKVASIAKNYSSKVIIGGPHPTIDPDSVINQRDVDAICLGEGEKTLSDYVNDSLKNTARLWFKKSGKIIKTPLKTQIIDLNNLLSPNLDCFDVERYIKNWVQLDSYSPNLRGLSVIASRGCPYNCTFCQPTTDKLFGKKIRAPNPKIFARYLNGLKKRYSLEAFYFQDDTLTFLDSWINIFCKELIKQKVDIKWCCNTRVDTLNFGSLKLMKKAGLVKLKVGFESASDRILKEIYKKNITLKQTKEFIKKTKNEGIQVSGFFMIGAPTETEKEIKETIEFASDSQIDEASFTITTPFYGTHVYNLALKEGWNLPKKFEDFDYYKTNRPQIKDTDIHNTRLELYKKYAYLRFYLKTSRLKNTLHIIKGKKGFYKALRKLKTYFF